ncbi:MAG: FtsQ-type POTRA domain-containing protein [Wigglesworthia glossinidia]|nr:FtsQ-type POTRA domain-containing protein [Wigglesworthia glossinidia]
MFIKNFYKKRKKSYEVVFLFISLGCIAWFIWSIVKFSNILFVFPLSKIVIKGNRNFTTKEDINQIILNIKYSKKFIQKDIITIQTNIKRMPWIQEACIEKKWPDFLIIKLLEYTPIGFWNESYFIDIHGKIFYAPKNRLKKVKNLPKIYAPLNTEKNIFHILLKIKNILEKEEIFLSSIYVGEQFTWELTIENNLKIRLGRYDKIYRLKRFVKVYPVLLKIAQKENKKIKYIDLRYNSGLAIGYK